MKRACKDEYCTQIHEDPKLSQIQKLQRVPSGLFKDNYFRIKLRTIAGMLLLMILTVGVSNKTQAAPYRTAHGYHRYGNCIKYKGGHGGGCYHRSHGYYKGGGYHHGYRHTKCGYVHDSRGCRKW